MFHIFSLVCFIIYGVNNRFSTLKTDSVVFVEKKDVFLEGFVITWSFWDMMDMSKSRLLVPFHMFQFPN